MKEAYAQDLTTEDDEESVGDEIAPRDVGHNIYILAHQVRTKTLEHFSFCVLSGLLLTLGMCTPEL